MAEVVLADGARAGLAEMIAGLVRAGVAADPARERLLQTRRGAVEIVVPDAGVVVGLTFVPGTLTIVDRPVGGADLRIVADADVVLGLAGVPLVAGLPDLRTAAGRELASHVVRGRLRLRLRPAGLGLLRTVTRLLSVA